MLKPAVSLPVLRKDFISAAFGRLCVETLTHLNAYHFSRQPPSGGCVLKLGSAGFVSGVQRSAAFGRLCVETMVLLFSVMLVFSAAFGRLCVETISKSTSFNELGIQPPSGGCVLKPARARLERVLALLSRLRAAVC